MRRLLPAPSSEIGHGDLHEAYAFPDTLPWVRGSMVSSLDGAIRGSDGLSGTVSSPADRALFPVLRETADVVLVGAGTATAEDYGPASMPMAIVTGSGRLAASARVFTGSHRAIIVTSEAGATRVPADVAAMADVLVAGTDGVDLGTAIAALHRRGLSRVHCEGGPALLSSLAAAGLLDEMLVTITPQIVGGPEHIVDVVAGAERRGTPTQVLTSDGSVFVRVRLRDASC